MKKFACLMVALLGLCFTADGQTLAAGGGMDGQPGPIFLWKMTTGNESWERRGHSSGTLAIVLTLGVTSSPT